MGKLATPDWVKEGFYSKADWEKKHGTNKKGKKSRAEKVFKLRLCPKCRSDNVNVVLTGEEGKGTKEWECKKCKWVGKNIEEKEVTEDEFMEYLDKRGEEVA